MALETGTRLGPYEIRSSLGAGGMGEVYRATDSRLGRDVALKVLPAVASGEALSRERLEREARTVSALSHPNICPLFDIGEHEGQVYLVMECLDGQTLLELQRASVLTVDTVMRIGAQIAEGLDHAHAAGVIHRDLKPGNVMVLPNGRIKILDFGLARKESAATDATAAGLTETGIISGTAAYMSPEQTLGQRVDYRSDIFSLGVVLYEMLTRRRPFEGASAFAVMQNVVQHNPPPVELVRPEVPPAVARLVAQMMAKAPAERPTAADVATVLWQSSTSSSPADTGLRRSVPAAAIGVQGSPASQRSSRRVYALIAGIALILASIVVGRWWLTSRVSAMPTAAAIAEPATALEHTQQGLGLLRRFDRAGAVEKAIAAFESAIALDKSYAPAWSGLARAYWRQQRDTRDESLGARAADAANQAITLDPYLADAQVSLGLVRLQSGDVAGAKAAFEHALVLEPANAAAHRGLGDLAEGEDRLADATTYYEKAVSLDHDDWELPRLLGDIPYAAAKYDEALTWYVRASQAAPDSAVPYRLIGAANHMRGDYPAAATAFQKSLSIQPSSGGFTNLGTALFYQGLYRESLKAFERAVEMAPSNPLVWGNVGDAYRWVPGNTQKMQESYARALQLLREQLAKDPKHVANRSRLALYLAKSGDTQSGLAELAKVLTPDVREVNTLYRGAVTYELAGDRGAALRTLELALERGYAIAEIRMDPELAKLRSDIQYHKIIARFEHAVASK